MSTPSTTLPETEIKTGIRVWARRSIVIVLLMGLILFLSGGDITWMMAWAFLTVEAAGIAINGIVLIRRSPELLFERAKMQTGTKSWDRLLAPTMALFGPLVTLLGAGLEHNFGPGAGLPDCFLGSMLGLAAWSSIFTTWAMASNPYFSGTVRIQADRGQEVASGGPYRWVRHPGYLGAALFQLATPLVLDSFWALVPAVLTVAVIVIRTALEDQTLHAELPGYPEYARQVKYRLMPYIW